MPNALGIGLLGPLQVRDETGSLVHVGGRQLRVLLTLLALNAGRVVPAGSLAGELWPDDPPGNPGNALQTLVSRLRAELRQAGVFNPRRGAGEGGRGPGGDAGAGGVHAGNAGADPVQRLRDREQHDAHVEVLLDLGIQPGRAGLDHRCDSDATASRAGTSLKKPEATIRALPSGAEQQGGARSLSTCFGEGSG